MEDLQKILEVRWKVDILYSITLQLLNIGKENISDMKLLFYLRTTYSWVWYFFPGLIILNTFFHC